MKRIFYMLSLLCLPLLAHAMEDGNSDDIKYPVPKSYNVTFSPQGWATFNSPYAVTITDPNVKVYIVTNSSVGAVSPADYVATLHLVECPKTPDLVRYIPQREPKDGPNHKFGCVNPVVLRYDEEALKTKPSPTITLEVLEADQDQPSQYQDCLYKSYLNQPNGLLLGTDDVPYEYVSDEEDSERKLKPIGIADVRWPYHALGAVDGDFHTYVLGFTQKYGMAFYEVAPGKALPANRAYIEIANDDRTTGSPRFTIEIDDDPTGLTAAPLNSHHATDGILRDLSGHEVSTPQPGQVYIKDHHKFLHH